jgi:ankyrin repeat protein
VAPPFSPVALDANLPYDATLADIERRVRAGVRPDRLRLGHNERALYWVCQSTRLRHDGPDEVTVARRIRTQLEVIQLLLRQGAKPNRIAARGSTPLSVCCREFTGCQDPWVLEKLQLLLAAGANPRLCKDSPLCTLLGLRDMRGEVLMGVLEADAVPAKQAIVFQAIDALLQAGATLEGMDHREMYTPLLLASYLGSLPLVRFLVERGANVNATNPAGTNALMQAAGDAEGLKSSRAGISSTWHRFGDPVAVTRQLLAWGVDPAAANARGRTPLRLAVNAGNLDVAAVLAEALAVQGKLLKSDVRLFKGSAFEAQVAPLAVGVRTPTPPRVGGSAQGRGSLPMPPGQAVVD